MLPLSVPEPFVDLLPRQPRSLPHGDHFLLLPVGLPLAEECLKTPALLCGLGDVLLAHNLNRLLK